MASLTELRSAVAELLSGLDGRVLVYAGKTEYGRGLDGLTLIVRVLVGSTHDAAGQERLDRMLEPSGPESVKALLDADDTLGGRVSDARVVSATGYQTFRAQEGALELGCEWTAKVLP